ncbi:hypothetical protein BJ508DRAFT_334243 [Ascobolus immersus RN42]|uniref:Uncharacterized protein n=1 Tax=Ascobolus immersus RN42 TaxID=1160509 RepID=A0A3N4HJY9_ASCIM|nr:hypothetical protein BJ508DRAFT_334243 [Ascobolus immersus RN42]
MPTTTIVLIASTITTTSVKTEVLKITHYTLERCNCNFGLISTPTTGFAQQHQRNYELPSYPGMKCVLAVAAEVPIANLYAGFAGGSSHAYATLNGGSCISTNRIDLTGDNINAQANQASTWKATSSPTALATGILLASAVATWAIAPRVVGRNPITRFSLLVLGTIYSLCVWLVDWAEGVRAREDIEERKRWENALNLHYQKKATEAKGKGRL